MQKHIQGIMALSFVILLIALIVTIAVVSNPTFAVSHPDFKNRAECIEVLSKVSVVRNHYFQSAKVSNELG